MPRWLFPALVVFFLAGHAVCRGLTYHHLEYDEAEQLTLVQTFSLGYYYQPPLFTWLLWPLVQLLGPSIVPLLVLRTFLFGLIFGLSFHTALRVSGDHRSAGLAALSLVFIPEIFHGVIGMWTHTSLLVVLTLATLLLVLRLHERPTTRDYVLLGVCAGLGVLAKYNFVHFATALGLALAVTPGWRAVIFDRRIVLAIGIAAVLVLPHGLWMLDHADEVRHGVLRYTEIRQDQLEGWQGTLKHLSVNLVQTFGRSFGFVLLALAVLILPAWRTAAKEHGSDVQQLLLHLLLAAGMLLAGVMLFGGVRHLRQHWLTPFAVLIAPLLLARFEFTRLAVWQVRCFQVVLVLTIAGAVGWRGLLIARHEVEGRLNARDDLYAAQADQLRAAGWDETYALAEHPYAAGYLRLHFPHARVRCAYFPSHELALAEDQPVLITWHGGVTETKRYQKFTSLLPLALRSSPPQDGVLSLHENPHRYEGGKTIVRSLLHIPLPVESVIAPSPAW